MNSTWFIEGKDLCVLATRNYFSDQYLSRIGHTPFRFNNTFQ